MHLVKNDIVYKIAMNLTASNIQSESKKVTPRQKKLLTVSWAKFCPVKGSLYPHVYQI